VEYSETGHVAYGGMSLKIRASLSTMSSSSTSSPGIRDVSSSPVYSNPRVSEGPKRRTREGGSEWEPIKILFKNSAYEPKFTRAPQRASLAKFT
jgi:hypothetical protein